MAIKMVREPSETPNINNIDDIVPMRYAYGNQNGYVIGKGNEISNTVNGLNFTVNSGRLVLQGVECDIDAVGVTIAIDNIATKRYYVIYLEVNLGLNSATIKSEYDTATYPSIDVGDDLTENTTGVARLPLYRFTATSGIISDVNKVVESVKYTKDVKVNNSSKVNDLEIKQDENGILKIGDIVIPQKKLIWSGEQSLSSGNESILIETDEIKNKTFEVIFKPEKYMFGGYEFVGYAPTNLLAKTYEEFEDYRGGKTSYNSSRFSYIQVTTPGIDITDITISPYLQRSSNQHYIRVLAGKRRFDWEGNISGEEVHMKVIEIYEVIE